MATSPANFAIPFANCGRERCLWFLVWAHKMFMKSHKNALRMRTITMDSIFTLYACDPIWDMSSTQKTLRSYILTNLFDILFLLLFLFNFSSWSSSKLLAWGFFFITRSLNFILFNFPELHGFIFQYMYAVYSKFNAFIIHETPLTRFFIRFYLLHSKYLS